MSIYKNYNYKSWCFSLKVLSTEFKFWRLCENEMRLCFYTVYQLSMLISIYEDEVLKDSV